MPAEERNGESGFTLVELLMVIAMTGIIVTAIASALTVGLRTTDDTGIRLSETVDTQMLSAYLPQDVQNAGPSATDVSTASGDTAGCTGVVGSNVLALRWTDADTGTAYGVTYRTTAADGEQQLLRIACGGTTTTTTVVGRSLAPPPAGAVADISQNPRVTFTLKTATGYTGRVTAVRRTVGGAPPVPPVGGGGCTVESAALSPPSGSVTPAGQLVPTPVLTVTVAGTCGALSAQYQPAGTATTTTALLGSGTSRTASLVATGWTAGDRPVGVFLGAAKLGEVPFLVEPAAVCQVTNVRTSPSSGTRSKNPSPNTLTEGAVIVTADFGPTCGATKLIFDPASNSTSPSAQGLDFPATGASRSVEISGGTAWSDGAHTLLVKEGTETRATGGFAVTPATCVATSLVVTPSTVGHNRQNGNLETDLKVTLQTTGVCSGLRVSYVPNAAAGTTVRVALAETSTGAGTWTAQIKKTTDRWDGGTKTFVAERADGTSFGLEAKVQVSG